MTQCEAEADRPHQNPDVVTFSSASMGLETMLITSPRITSTMPDGGEISPALLDKCRVEGKAKLKTTAARAAEKVPSR